MSSAALDAPPRPCGSELVPSAASTRRTGRAWLRRPFVACALLFIVYAALSFTLNDPRGTLGTDTGGKLATLHMMDRNQTLVPEVGYWAAKSDPKGDLHPLFYTFEVDGKWVNVTTLPMIYAAYPLFEVGGDRAVLVLPMIGAVLCALAARALARRLGGGSGWSAFWIIGLLSPVAIYALDFWEHSLGLALMLWGVVWLLRGTDDLSAKSAFIAGVLFGAAATMRTEALVYLAVCGGIACLAQVRRSRALGGTLQRGVLLLGGAALPLFANEFLEHLVLGGTIRAGRAASTAADAGVSATVRIQEALTTLVGMNRLSHVADYLYGALIVVCVVLGVRALARGEDRVPVAASAALAGAVFLYLIGLSGGLGFVPGMLTASPFAALGAVIGWRRDLRLATTMAVVALPVVWVFQYSGGAGPQWGGRYTLLSSAVLLVVATVALERHRAALISACVVAALVTGFGLAWLSVRSHGVAHAFERIVTRHDEAVISGEAHYLREGGAFYDASRHWLTTTSPADLHRAIRTIRRVGDTEFAYVVASDSRIPREVDGYRRTNVELVQFLRPDIKLKIGTYRTS